MSEPSPLFQTSVSLPAPPFMTSAPFAADEAVVAVAAVERVVAVGAGQDVVAAVAVEPGAGDLGVLREHRERVVAVAAVDDDGERAVGRARSGRRPWRCPSPSRC